MGERENGVHCPAPWTAIKRDHGFTAQTILYRWRYLSRGSQKEGGLLEHRQTADRPENPDHPMNDMRNFHRSISLVLCGVDGAGDNMLRVVNLHAYNIHL